MDGWTDGYFPCVARLHVIVMVAEHHGSVPFCGVSTNKKMCTYFTHTLCFYAYRHRGHAHSCMNKYVTDQTCSASTLNTYALQSMHALTALCGHATPLCSSSACELYFPLATVRVTGYLKIDLTLFFARLKIALIYIPHWLINFFLTSCTHRSFQTNVSDNASQACQLCVSCRVT